LADLVTSLTLDLLPRLGQEPAAKEGFRDWLLNGTYRLEGVSDGIGVEFQNFDLKEFVRYVAFDFERFSLSSRESFAIARAETVTYNLAGWPLLKLYYSAFFAAHAILRSQGGGIVKLDRRHARHLNSVLDILSPGSDLMSPGMFAYTTERSPETGRLVVALKPAPKGGGVHEDFWTYFCSFLEARAEKALEKGAANAAEFISGASEISAAIKDGGIGTSAWFSGVRNEINYQHKYDVWFPLRRDGKVLGIVNGVQLADSNSIRMDVSKRRHPVAAFSKVAQYLACLSYEISETVAKRSTAGRAFGQKWRRIVEQV
jgi:hypothetical protein